MKRYLPALALAATAVLLPTSAHAEFLRGPVHCNGVRCMQTRTHTFSGEFGVETVTSKRTAPRESRGFDHLLHWSNWRVVSVTPGKPQS